MSIDDVSKIVDKVRIYRTSFGSQFDKAGLSKLKVEWHRVLEPYDYDDVNRKLDEFFKDGNNYAKYPDPYGLVKFLTKHADKLKIGHQYVRCNLCGSLIDYEYYDTHYDRCSSVNYIYKMSLKYFGKKLNKEKMMEADKKLFEDYYLNFCQNLLPIVNSGIEKHLIENTIRILQGKEPSTDFKEVRMELNL